MSTTVDAVVGTEGPPRQRDLPLFLLDWGQVPRLFREEFPPDRDLLAIIQPHGPGTLELTAYRRGPDDVQVCRRLIPLYLRTGDARIACEIIRQELEDAYWNIP